MSLQAPMQAATSGKTLQILIGGDLTTQIVLGITAVISLASWVIIFWKLGQFRRLRREGARFLQVVERTQRIEEAAKAAMRLPESPYSRLLRRGYAFVSDLSGGESAGGSPVAVTLTDVQLQALKLTLDQTVDEERDAMAGGLVWLAIIAVVSPLLGLLGTVIGVMDAFLGITATGTSNIASVAPGIAEALVTTVGGLVAAIPAVIAYNYFASRLGEFAGELDGFSTDFLAALAREGRL